MLASIYLKLKDMCQLSLYFGLWTKSLKRDPYESSAVFVLFRRPRAKFQDQQNQTAYRIFLDNHVFSLTRQQVEIGRESDYYELWLPLLNFCEWKSSNIFITLAISSIYY